MYTKLISIQGQGNVEKTVFLQVAFKKSKTKNSMNISSKERSEIFIMVGLFWLILADDVSLPFPSHWSI